MFANVKDTKDFLHDILQNIYRKNIKSFTPVHYDLQTLSDNLVAGKVAYFGTLTFNRLLWAKHAPQTIPSAGLSYIDFTELYTAMLGKLNQALSINDQYADQYFGTLGTMQLNNLLFDDLLFTHQIFTNDAGNIQYEDTHSYSFNKFSSITAPIIGGGTQKWHVPFMSFIGYKIGME